MMFYLEKEGKKTITKTKWFRDILIKKGWKEDGKTEQGNTERQETETKQTEEVKHVGAGWYELPNGERIRGKDNAIEALKG